MTVEERVENKMRKLNQKIGFIGCGNMGGAILQGILRNKLASASQIVVHDPFAKNLSKFKVRIAKSNRDVIKNSDIIILAIKPQELANLAKDLGTVPFGTVPDFLLKRGKFIRENRFRQQTFRKKRKPPGEASASPGGLR